MNIKNWHLRIFFAAGLALALPWAALALDNDGCSNGTLKGDYAFTVTGQIFHSDGTTDTRAGVAMTDFDGAGNLSQADFVMSSALAGPVPSPDTDPASGFHNNETGTYTVNPDCTGNATINSPSGIVIKLKLVVFDSGRSVHTVVSSITLPNGGSPGTPLIRSEGRKLIPTATTVFLPEAPDKE
jgi:hypothetical protein